MKKLLSILLVLVFSLPALSPAPAHASLYLLEDFDYPQTLLTDTGSWAAHSGAGTNPITL
jgi:hypothetical protein